MFKQSVKSFSWNLIGSGLSFLFQIYAARILGAREFGIANYYLGFSATITIFTFFGVQFFLPKYIATSSKKQELFQNSFWTLTILYLFTIPIQIGFLWRYVSTLYLILVIVLTYLTVMVEVISSYLIGLSKAELASLLKNFLVRFLNVVAFVTFITLLGKTHDSYLFSLLLTYLLFVIVFLVKNIHRFSVNFSIIVLSWKFYLIQILYGLFNSLSRVLQGNYGNFESVAVLSVGLVLSNIVTLLGTNFTNVLMPHFAISWKQNDLKNIQCSFQKYTRINAYFILPIVIFIIFYSEKILNFLGKDYKGGGLILSFLLLGQFVNSFVGPNGTILLMTGYERFEVYNGIIKILSASILIFLLGPVYFWGIAFALALSEIVVNLLKMVELGFVFKIWPYKLRDFLYIIGLFIVEVSGFLLISHLKYNDIMLYAINCVFIILIFIMSFWFSPNCEDKAVFKQGRSYFLKKIFKM